MPGRVFQNYQWIVDYTMEIPKHDIKSSKVSSVMGYLIFIIPWVFGYDKQFARFHCNQSLINLFLSTLVALLLGMIPYIGAMLLVLQELLCLVWMIRGMVLAARGKAVSIPLVGWITIIPYRVSG